MEQDMSRIDLDAAEAEFARLLDEKAKAVKEAFEAGFEACATHYKVHEPDMDVILDLTYRSWKK